MHSVLYYWVNLPIRMIRMRFAAAPAPSSCEASSTRQTQPLTVPLSVSTAPWPDSDKNSGCDAASEPSEIASIKEVSKSVKTVPAQPGRTSEDKVVSQAHLPFLGKSDGLDVSPKPCHGRRIKPEAVLAMGWFSKSGSRVVSPVGPAVAAVCGKRREYYTVRKAEYKCQTGDFFETGILIESRGSEILECPVRLQI